MPNFYIRNESMSFLSSFGEAIINIQAANSSPTTYNSNSKVPGSHFPVIIMQLHLSTWCQALDQVLSHKGSNSITSSTKQPRVPASHSRSTVLRPGDSWVHFWPHPGSQPHSLPDLKVPSLGVFPARYFLVLGFASILTLVAAPMGYW